MQIILRFPALFFLLLSFTANAQDTSSVFSADTFRVIHLLRFEKGKPSSHSDPAYIFPGQTIRIRTRENHHPQLGRLISVTDSSFVMRDSSLRTERVVLFRDLAEIGWRENNRNDREAKKGKPVAPVLMITGGTIFALSFSAIVYSLAAGELDAVFWSTFPFAGSLIMMTAGLVHSENSTWHKRQISRIWHISAGPPPPPRISPKAKNGKQKIKKAS